MSDLVIISHYNEDLSWLKNIKTDYYILSKTEKSANFYQEINRGNESSSYLEFIINNYENLTQYKKLIFLHAHRFSWHQRFNADHLINNLDTSLVKDYLNLNDEYYYEIYPDKVVSSGKVNYVSDNKVYLILQEIWDELFASEFGNQPDYIGMIPGAQFVIDPKLILRRNKKFYEKLLSWLISEDSFNLDLKFEGNGNTYSSRVLEWTWNKIFNDNYQEVKQNIDDFLWITK